MIFSNIPVDIIVYLGKFLDYDSIINLNQTMQPIDRLINRRFTKTELLAHEIAAVAQGNKMTVERLGDYEHHNVKYRIRNKCRYLLKVFQAYRKNNRGHILVQTHPMLRNVLIEKCQDVLSTERVFNADITKCFLEKIHSEASNLMKDLVEIVPREKPKKNGKINI